MQSANIRDYADAAKNIVYALGIVAAGVWTFAVFNMTLAAKNAEASLEKLQATLHERPIIQTTVSAAAIGSNTAKETTLRIKVTTKNSGNADAAVTIDEQSIRVGRVQLNKNKIAAFVDPVFTGIYLVGEPASERGMLKVGTITLLANQEHTFNAIVSVPEDGLYAIDFIGTASANVQSEISAVIDKEKRNERILVEGSTYITVGAVGTTTARVTD